MNTKSDQRSHSHIENSGVFSRTILFILSSDRSGSTWVGYVLGSGPRSAFVGEFRRAWDVNLRQPCAWCAAHGLNTCRVFSGIEDYPPEQAFELAFDRTNADLLIDSSKRLAWAERFIAHNCSSRIHFLHLIRDPRGWYSSESRRRTDDRKALIDEWVAENRSISEFVQTSGKPFSTVFYDELAANPESGFREVFQHLCRSFHPEALRYWEKVHHGFAANGASWPVLRQGSNVSNLSHFVTGDDRFYRTQGGSSFVDRRWRQALATTDEIEIRQAQGVVDLLRSYGRVLTADTLAKAS